MLSFFTKSYLYIKVYKNEMEVTDLQDNVTIRRQPSQNFSTDRMLIADFRVAEELLKSMIKELPVYKRFAIAPSIAFLIQHMVDLGDGICDVEKRTLRDIADYQGVNSVFILPHTDKLSNEQALQKLTMGLKGGAFTPPDLVA